MIITQAVVFIVALSCVCVFPVQADRGQAPGAVIYVAAHGNDSGDGSIASPLASIVAAQRKIREWKSLKGLPRGGVTVEIFGGWYQLMEPIEFTSEDSGTAEAPIVYRARGGDKVVLSGGRFVTNWQQVTMRNNPTGYKQLDPSAQGKVYQAELTELGITEYGDLLYDAEWKIQYRHSKDDNQREAIFGDALAAKQEVERTGRKIEPRLELFYNNEPMTLSRWPNSRFASIDKALGKTEFHVRRLQGRREGIFSVHRLSGCHEGQGRCGDNYPSRWINEKNAMVRGYWFRDWVVQTQKIASIDPEQPIITLAEPYHLQGYRNGMWFFGFNMLCEIDKPGEWYLDRENGTLYFWPPKPLENAKTEVSVTDGLFRLNDTGYITLHGLNLETIRGTAVRIKNSENCRVTGCVIRNATNYGVTIVDGKNCSVIGCDISATGGGGVFMAGGDRQQLVSAGHAVENCHIHHFARWDRTYRPGILMTGVGLRASHNLIHHAPHSAIIYGGPLHRIDFNEIHNVCQESHDCGAIYGGRSWCMRGNVFEYNYLHHICGKGGRASNGIYLDDGNSGATIRGNVFHKLRRPVLIGGGRDNLVENNIFIDCPQAFHMDGRYAPGNWAARIGDKRIKKARKTGILNGVRFSEPPYSVYFPKLAKMMDNQPTQPMGNILRGNIFWQGDRQNLQRLNRKKLPSKKRWRQEEWWFHIHKSVWDLVSIENNLIDEDPKFVDEKSGDFQLRNDSPAWKIGFKAIPFETIGLYQDDTRARWPVTHKITPLPGIPERRPGKNAKPSPVE
ncbi:right-handed parallel beta-helix repeat-containing protein [Desulfogranum japonicum]|uniref:right-handed parallel beta-helix repeat-containing protein n=1 Tax=Desulfogranum japonicum TaxID=231447 RepID=UPI00048ED5D7|nr:right-handed parallel beta-helix repeat-containing protein [Desulfogranum japonicum]